MLLLNGKQVNYFYFSGGEMQVTLPEIDISQPVVLNWKPVNTSDIMLLLLTVNSLNESKIYNIDLNILYLPYARQDRVCMPGEAFSLRVMCQLLNMLHIHSIRIWDVHNPDYTFKLLSGKRLWNFEACDIFIRYRILSNFDHSRLALCAPDKGAVMRVEQIINYYDLESPILLEKTRDPSTGHISKFNFNEHNRSIEGLDVMIVDDICDGGATFLMAAELLKSRGAKDIYLYVTHGIFSKGVDALLQHFKHIICHHVLHDIKYQSTERLTILKEHPIVSQSSICH